MEQVEALWPPMILLEMPEGPGKEIPYGLFNLVTPAVRSQGEIARRLSREDWTSVLDDLLQASPAAYHALVTELDVLDRAAPR